MGKVGGGFDGYDIYADELSSTRKVLADSIEKKLTE